MDSCSTNPRTLMRLLRELISLPPLLLKLVSLLISNWQDSLPQRLTKVSERYFSFGRIAICHLYHTRHAVIFELQLVVHFLSVPGKAAIKFQRVLSALMQGKPKGNTITQICSFNFQEIFFLFLLTRKRLFLSRYMGESWTIMMPARKILVIIRRHKGTVWKSMISPRMYAIKMPKLIVKIRSVPSRPLTLCFHVERKKIAQKKHLSHNEKQKSLE